MRKLQNAMMTLITICLVFTSCSKMSESTYSLTNDTGMNGTVFVHECNDSGETINVVNSYFADGQTKQFTAAENAVKVKLYIDELDKWVQQFFYLKEGGHLDIFINGNELYLRFHSGSMFEAGNLKNGVLDRNLLQKYFYMLNFTYNLSNRIIKLIHETEI